MQNPETGTTPAAPDGAIASEARHAAMDTVGLTPRLLARLERSELPPAVVVGTEVNGLTVARALAAHGIPVLGVDHRRRRYTGYSGAFELVHCPGFRDRAGFLEFLDRLADALPRPAALFLTMDEHVLFFAAADAALRSRYLIDFPEPATVDLLMNKQRFTAYAAERGWPVPRSVFCRSIDELRAQMDALTFPVILKPRLKNRAFRSQSPAKAFHCASAAELLERYALVAQWEPEAVVQEWIPGGDDEILFSFHYFDAALRELAAFEGRKLRQWVPECGSTSCAVGVAQSRVSELSREILRDTRCVGIGSVEYKRDPRTDRVYIMEPTVGRTNMQIGVAVANGADLVSRAYFHLIDRPYPGTERPTHDRKWILLGSDLRSAAYWVRRGELTWPDYVRSLRGPRRFAVWSARDYPMLFGLARDWAGKPGRLVRRMLGRAAATSTSTAGDTR